MPCSAGADEENAAGVSFFEIGPAGVRIHVTTEYNTSMSRTFREFLDQDGNGYISRAEYDDWSEEFLDLPLVDDDNSTFNISVDGITEYELEYEGGFGNILGPVNTTINLTWETDILYRFDTRPGNVHTIVFMAANSTDPDDENNTIVDDNFKMIAADGWRFKSVNHPEYMSLSNGSTEMTLDPMFNETITDDLVIVIEKIASDDDDDSIPGYGLMVLTSSVLLATIMVTIKRSHPR